MEDQPPVAQSPISSPAKKNNLRNILLAALLTALVVGGATYAIAKHQQNNATADLQSQIDSLRAQLVTAEATPTATPVVTATPTPKATASASPTATATATPSATPTSSPVADQPCANGNLSFAMVASAGGGAAGTNYIDAAITNTGTVSCTMKGFPTISLLNSAGTTLGTASTSGTASIITIAAGKVAYAAVGFPNPGNYADTNTCEAAATITAVAPDTTTVLKASTTQSYCPGFSVGPMVLTKP